MLKVLIVDDDEDNLDMIGDFLEAAGYECTLASDVEHARSCLDTDEFQLILSDFNMPGESGLDLLRFASAHHPETAMILMSGYEDPRIQESAMEMGARAYLSKPFESGELLAHVMSALGCRPESAAMGWNSAAQLPVHWLG